MNEQNAELLAEYRRRRRNLVARWRRHGQRAAQLIKEQGDTCIAVQRLDMQIAELENVKKG